MPLFFIIVALLFCAFLLKYPRLSIFLLILILPSYLVRAPIPLPFLTDNFLLALPEALTYILVLFAALIERGFFLRNIRTVFQNEKVLFFGTVFLFIGLFAGLTQSNDFWASVGIIRGWFFAPILLFLVFTCTTIGKNGAETAVRALAISAVCAAVLSMVWPLGFNPDGRLQGFYGSPNYLAMYLAPLMPLILYYLYVAWRGCFGERCSWWEKYAWLFGFGPVSIALVFSMSQGAWLGLFSAAFGAIVWFFARKHPRYLRRVFVFSAAFLSSFAFMFIWFFQDFLRLSFYSRLGVWQAAWNMGAESPLFGIGAGMFQIAYQFQKHIVAYPVPTQTALHPHNIFFTFWLYGGILGLIGFLAIIFWIAKKVCAHMRGKQQNALWYGVLGASFAVILVHGLVDTTYWKNDLAFMWWVLAALLICGKNSTETLRPQVPDLHRVEPQQQH